MTLQSTWVKIRFFRIAILFYDGLSYSNCIPESKFPLLLSPEILPRGVKVRSCIHTFGNIEISNKITPGSYGSLCADGVLRLYSKNSLRFPSLIFFQIYVYTDIVFQIPIRQALPLAHSIYYPFTQWPQSLFFFRLNAVYNIMKLQPENLLTVTLLLLFIATDPNL